MDENKDCCALRFARGGEGYMGVYDAVLATFVYVWYFPYLKEKKSSNLGNGSVCSPNW